MFFNTLCALNDKKQLNYEIHPIQKKLKRDDLIKKIKEEEQNIEVKQEYVEEQIDIKYKHSKNNIDIKKEIEDRIKIEVEEEEKRYAKAVWSIFLSDFKNIHIKENLFIGLTFLKKEIKENLSNQRLYRIQIEEVNKKNNEEIMIENYVKLYLIMQYQIIITFLSLKKHQIFFHHKLLLLFSGSCCGYFSTYREKNFFKNQSYGTSITMRNRFKKYLENVKNQLNIEVDQYESLFKQKVILPNKVLINNREYYEIDKKYYNNIKKTDQFHLISIIETCV